MEQSGAKWSTQEDTPDTAGSMTDTHMEVALARRDVDHDAASRMAEWVDAELEELSARRASIEQRIDALDEETKRLTILRNQLRWLLGLESAAESAPTRSPGHQRLEEMTRVDAVHTVLSRASGPLSPADIRDKLRERGRSDEYRLVSSSLDHLRRMDRAHRVGRGEWVVGPAPKDGG